MRTVMNLPKGRSRPLGCRTHGSTIPRILRDKAAISAKCDYLLGVNTGSHDARPSDDIDVRRVRVFSIIACSALALFLVYRFLTGHMPIFFVILTASIVAGTGLVISLLGKSPRLTAHLTLLGASISVGGTQIQDGRIESTALWVITVIPFVAGHILGIRAIAGYSFLAALFILFSMWGEQLGIPLPEQLVPKAFSWVNLRLFSLLTMTAVGIQMARDNKARVYKAARKMLESEQAHRKALAHNEEKARFLTQMSQEIRGPMNGIKGIAQHWATIAKAPEPRESVEVIDRCADRLMSMIQDIQDISKIEQGKIQIFREPFLLNLAMSDVSRLFHARASSKGLKLELQGPNEPHWVIGDAQRLVQILANLVGNAIKFSDQGTVLLRWSCPAKNNYCFEVVDEGIGMTAEQLSQLFERYHQVNLDQGVLRGGTGLGLTISKALSQAMGGGLVATSEHGQGSTFTLTLDLPLCSDQGSAPRETNESIRRQRDLSLLVIDPDDTSFLVLQLSLESMGCTVVRCVGPAQATVLAESQAFDLIVLDLQTRSEQALLLIQRIRETCELNRSTPAIATTTIASPQFRQRCQDAGLADLLVKPLAPQALVRSIDVALDASSRPQEAA